MKKLKFIKIISACFFTGLFVFACSSNNTAEQMLSTGSFIDSAVEGLDYSTPTQNGTTTIEGEFVYMDGENITFSIGDLKFPTVKAASLITPITLAENSANSEVLVTNIARLLQSLDEDDDVANGIKIPESAKIHAGVVDFNMPVIEFENDQNVVNLLANSGSSRTTILSSSAAINHLYETIGEQTNTETEFDANLVGFWLSENSDDYVEITLDGSVSFYDYSMQSSCYSTRQGSLSLVRDSLYLLESAGQSVQILITVVDSRLIILSVDSFTKELVVKSNELGSC